MLCGGTSPFTLKSLLSFFLFPYPPLFFYFFFKFSLHSEEVCNCSRDSYRKAVVSLHQRLPAIFHPFRWTFLMYQPGAKHVTDVYSQEAALSLQLLRLCKEGFVVFSSLPLALTVHILGDQVWHMLMNASFI